MIASGSNGNAAYLSSSEGTLIIDAGISRKRIVNALNEDNIPVESVIGIIISHYHADHCIGLPILCETLRNVPIFCSKGTLEGLYSFQKYDPRWIEIGRKCQTFSFGNYFTASSFDILPMRTLHDAKDSSAFQIAYNDIKISVITDTGRITDEHLETMQDSSLILLETNHNIEALKNSKRPNWLKKRIRASHLANSESSEVFDTLIESPTKGIFLGHLSGECNSPNLVGLEIQQWQSENTPPWNWYICKRDTSGKMAHFNGKKIRTDMDALDPNKIDKSFLLNSKKFRLDEFFKKNMR